MSAATSQQTRTSGSVEPRSEPVVLPPDTERALALALREAATNVVRHAAPATCRVEVDGTGDQLRIEISDDGTRRPHAAPGGAGLAGMRERVAAHGGTFEAGPQAGGGFAVFATLPYGSAS